MTIDIRGLNKAEVLMVLYNKSKQQGVGLFNPEGAISMSIEEAQTIIDATPNLYFDYLRGRVMKVSLKGDVLEEALYDRDNGPGATMKALTPLLKKRVSPS